MAVISKPISAKLQFKDKKKKVINSFTGVDPNVNPGIVELFSTALGALQSTAIETQHLIVEAELTEDAGA